MFRWRVLLLVPLLVAGVAVGAATPGDAAPTLAPRFAVTRPLARFNVTTGPDQVLSSPALGDVTGDGVPDIVVGSLDGYLRVLDTATGAEQRAVLVDDDGAIQATPTLVDVDGDPALEVAIGTIDTTPGESVVRIYDFATDPPATVFGASSWPGSNNAGFTGSPVLGDIDGDGGLDVVAVGLDQQLHAWRLDGSYLPGFPVYTYDTALATPSLADVDGDGRLDIVVGVDMDFGQPFPPGGYLWVVRGDGTRLPGYAFRLSSEVIWSSAAIGDVDTDGDPDLVVGTGRNFGSPEGNLLYAIDLRTASPLPGWPRPLDGNSMPSPALVNLDGDPQLEVVTVSGTGRAYAFEHDGGQRWASCARATFAGDCPGDVAILASPVVADVDDDGVLNVVIAGEREVIVLDATTGSVLTRAPTISEAGRFTYPGANAPAVGDVGGRTLVVAHLLVDTGDERRGAGDEQAVFAWDAGPAGGAQPWAQWHGDEAHRGVAVVLGPGGFTDTAGHTHAENIGKVAAAGIAGGFADGTYRPDDPVSRAQMATFLARGYRLPPASSPTFCDSAAAGVHEANIRAVAAAGIAQGSGGCFNPTGLVTRGQMAAFLARAEHLPLDAEGPTFCDTAGTQFEDEIRAVAAAGIAAGNAGCFSPDSPVTRGQMATFLARALRL